MFTSEEMRSIKSLCERHQGYMSSQQIAAGIVQSIINANALFQDGRLLHEHGRLGRAMSLLISCMEEVGKVYVLASMARISKKNQKLWREAWQNFRDHEYKATIAIMSTFPDAAREDPQLLLAGAIAQRIVSNAGERIRQFGLYTDFHAGDKRWLSPEEVTQEDVDRWLRWTEIALPKLEKMQSLGLFSERALAIMQEMYCPLNPERKRKKDLTMGDVKLALTEGPAAAKRYFRRLVDEGILPADADVTVLGISLQSMMNAG